MSRYIIDVKTDDAHPLVAQLKAQAWVDEAFYAGMYIYDSTYSQVIVDTDESEEFIDNWLYYDSTDIDWVGVVEAASH